MFGPNFSRDIAVLSDKFSDKRVYCINTDSTGIIGNIITKAYEKLKRNTHTDKQGGKALHIHETKLFLFREGKKYEQ